MNKPHICIGEQPDGTIYVETVGVFPKEIFSHATKILKQHKARFDPGNKLWTCSEKEQAWHIIDGIQHTDIALEVKPPLNVLLARVYLCDRPKKLSQWPDDPSDWPPFHLIGDPAENATLPKHCVQIPEDAMMMLAHSTTYRCAISTTSAREMGAPEYWSCNGG